MHIYILIISGVFNYNKFILPFDNVYFPLIFNYLHKINYKILKQNQNIEVNRAEQTKSSI